MKSTYENTILEEIRGFPEEALPQLARIIHSVKESIWITKFKPVSNESTEFCGIWKDSRDADEIITDIYSHRTGFSGRPVDL